MDKEIYEAKREKCKKVLYDSCEYWRMRALYIEHHFDETLPANTRLKFYMLWHELKSRAGMNGEKIKE